MFDRRPIILFAFWQLVILAFVGHSQLKTAQGADNELRKSCIEKFHVSQSSGCTCKRKAGYSTDMNIFYYGRNCLCNPRIIKRSFTDDEQNEDNGWMEPDTISNESSLQSNNSDSDGTQDTREAFYIDRYCICTLRGFEPFPCSCYYRHDDSLKPVPAPAGNYEGGYQGATVPTWSIALLVLLLGGIIVMSVSGFMLARRKRARNLQLAASSQGQFPSARMSSSIAPSKRSSLSRRSSSFRGRPTANSRSSFGPSRTGIPSSGKSRAASKASRLSTSSANSRSRSHASRSAPSSAKSGRRSESSASASRRRPSSLSSSSRRAR